MDKAEQPLYLAIGQGFNKEQLRSLIEALLPIQSGVINYAVGDEYPGQYDNQALIGAYGTPKNAISLQDAKKLIEKPDISIDEIYNRIEEPFAGD